MEFELLHDRNEEQLILDNQKQDLVGLLEKIYKIKLQLRNFDKSTGSLLEAQKIITLSRRYRAFTTA